MLCRICLDVSQSFEPSFRYDFHMSRDGSGWVCDRTESPEPLGGLSQKESRRLALPSTEIEAHLERICSVRVPLIGVYWAKYEYEDGQASAYEAIAVADGGSYTLTFFGGIQSTHTFYWRSNHPPAGWEPLELVVTELLELIHRPAQ